MKKALIILTLVCSLTLSLTAGAMANSVYIDGMVGSKWEKTANDTDDDMSCYIIGGDYYIDKFKIGFEYMNGTEDKSGSNNSDLDFSSFYVKGGYNLLNTDKYSIDATLAYYNRNYDDSDDTEINGILIGADATYKFNDRSYLEGAFGYSVSGKLESDTVDDDATTLLLIAKYTYLFTDNVGASLGYRYYKTTVDTNGDPEYNHYGPTVGVTYKF
jgi:hypothetical protein